MSHSLYFSVYSIPVPPPSSPSEPIPVRIRQGSPLRLRCPVKGSPAPTVKWVKHPFIEINTMEPEVYLSEDNVTLVRHNNQYCGRLIKIKKSSSNSIALKWQLCRKLWRIRVSGINHFLYNSDSWCESRLVSACFSQTIWDHIAISDSVGTTNRYLYYKLHQTIIHELHRF